MKKLESKTVKELIALAREWGLSGYSRLKKAELLKLLTKKKTPEAGRASSTKGSRISAKSAKKSKKTSKSSSNRSSAKSKTKSRPSASGLAKKARALASKARLGKRKFDEIRSKYSKPEIQKIEESKTPPPQPSPVDVGLPESYEDGRFGLMARDPHWLYCFWDLSSEQNKDLWSSGHAVLRVLSQGPNGTDTVETIPISVGAQSWYAYVKEADKEYVCELCSIGPDDSLMLIARSNPSTTPPDFASRQRKTAEKQAQSAHAEAETQSVKSTTTIADTIGQADEKTHEMNLQDKSTYYESLQPGTNLPSSMSIQQQAAQGRTAPQFAPSAHSPGQEGSLFEAHTAEGGQDAYWLNVDADVVIYGATKPGSQLILAGVPLELDDNGHFRARFALPDGSHSFNIEATSPDAKQHRTISIAIVRGTEP